MIKETISAKLSLSASDARRIASTRAFSVAMLAARELSLLIRAAVSSARSEARESSPTTRREASAETAAMRFATSVERLDAREPSAPIARCVSVARSAATERSPAMRLDTSVDICVERATSIKLSPATRREASDATS